MPAMLVATRRCGCWQSRPLEPMHSVVFFDALWVKIRGVHDILIERSLGCRAIRLPCAIAATTFHHRPKNPRG